MNLSTPHRGAGLPEIREIVRRFNDACRAFDEAVTASQAREADRYEAGLLRSAREMGSALDLAVVRCVGSTRPDLLLGRPDFAQLLEHLVASCVFSLDGGRVDQLKRWRRLRNEAEHAPVRVPPLTSLLEALRGARRFLMDALDKTADLGDPDLPSVTTARASEDRSATAIPLDDSHRKKRPDAWVGERIDEGLGRLNAGRAESPPLSATDVRRSLLGLARDLAERASAPSEFIPHSATAARTLDAYRRLYVEAGWLIEDAGGLRFRDPRLPALLVGLNLASQGIGAREKREALSSLGTWTEAAWAATAAGDFPHDWLRGLLDGTDLHRLPEYVVTACAALAGLGAPDRATAKLVERAAETAAEALVWLIPLRPEREEPTADQQDIWRLTHIVWQRAVLDLAKVTREFPDTEPSRGASRPPAGPLERLLAALGLAPRVPDATARAVRLLCRPWPCDGDSPLDEGFFRALWSVQDGVTCHVDSQFLETWIAEVGIPALWKGGEQRAARQLVVVAPHHPAGFLLNRPGLLSYWCEAWVCFAEAEPADEAARAWVLGARRAATTGGLDEGVEDFFLNNAPARLRELGVWDAARAQLAKELEPNLVPIRLDARQLQYCATLLAHAGLSPETWRQRIGEWSEGPNLPWQVLLSAGAPHDAIALWCVEKLRQKARETLNLDGPLAVVASGAEILKTEGWQLAYNQARDALDWLLDHGDESAVAVLAGACFAPNDNAQRCNPAVGSLLRASVLLSQVLWGRVLGRPGGRAALYTRIENGDGLGNDGHYLPVPFLSTTRSYGRRSRTRSGCGSLSTARLRRTRRRKRGGSWRRLRGG